MSHKTKAIAEAAEHGIRIDNFATSQRGEMWGNVMLTLPDGYQISDTDDRRGLSAEGGGASINEFWKLVRMDLRELIDGKDDWVRIN